MNTEGELKECGATVCIVGPGYVGLPLAEAFSRHIRVMSYDVDGAKVAELSDKEGGIEFTTDTHLKGESAIIGDDANLMGKHNSLNIRDSSSIGF